MQIDSNKVKWINWNPGAVKQSHLNQMKRKCIQTMQIDSNKAYWNKWKSSAFKQSLLNPMKAKCNQTKLIESNERQVHSNNANWFK